MDNSSESKIFENYTLIIFQPNLWFSLMQGIESQTPEIPWGKSVHQYRNSLNY